MSGWDGVIDNWYEEALANGQGFKSEEERQAYIDSLGDPEDHPMFATTAEQIAKHPLGDAFRCLREEDKTTYELVLMYKDEAAEFMKSKTKKDYKNAMDKYDEALVHLGTMESEREERGGQGTAAEVTSASGKEKKKEEEEDIIEEINSPSIQKREEEEEGQEAGKDKTTKQTEGDLGEHVDIPVLRSQIIGNKALAQLSLKNYRTCINVCDEAIEVWPGNMKAHFRKAKSLYMVRRFHEVRAAYDAAVAVAENNPNPNPNLGSGGAGGGGSTYTIPADLEAVYKQANKEIEKEAVLRRELVEKQIQRSREWNQVYDLCRLGGVNGVGFPSPRDKQQLQLKSVFPFYEDGVKTTENMRFPLLFLYPQYNEIDVVQAASAGDMLVAHLAVMFPELADLPAGSEAPVPWDLSREYEVSRLVVYLALDTLRAVPSAEAWKAGLADYYGEGDSGSSSSSSSSDGRKGEESGAKQSSGSGGKPDPAYCEVHLGCTLQQVLSCRRHVTAGGLTTLMAFPRGNPAHKKFLKDQQKAGYSFFQLDPGAREPKPKSV